MVIVRRFVSIVASVVWLAVWPAVAGRADVAASLPPPAQPSIAASGESVTVAWSPVANADGYRVQVSLNGGAYLDAAATDGATHTLEVDDLRSPSLSCGQGPCSVTARVAATSGGAEGPFSAPSVAVSLPMPYTIPMSVFRTNSPRQVTLVLYGVSARTGQVLHLLKMDSSQIWQDTGVTTVVHRQRVPGHRRAVQAWKFTVVVHTRGLSNYRVEIPAAGSLGEGISRPYGVRR